MEFFVDFSVERHIFWTVAAVNCAVNAAVGSSDYLPSHWVSGQGFRLPYQLVGHHMNLSMQTRALDDPPAKLLDCSWPPSVESPRLGYYTKRSQALLAFSRAVVKPPRRQCAQHRGPGLYFRSDSTVPLSFSATRATTSGSPTGPPRSSALLAVGARRAAQPTAAREPSGDMLCAIVRQFHASYLQPPVFPCPLDSAAPRVSTCSDRCRVTGATNLNSCSVLPVLDRKLLTPTRHTCWRPRDLTSLKCTSQRCDTCLCREADG